MSENLYQDTMLAAAALHHANDQRTPEQRQADMVIRGLLYPCEVTDPAVDTGRHHRKVGEEGYIERFTPPGRHRKPDDPGDIVQEIVKAGALARPWEWHPDHPQYVEGRLYLTGAQWQRVLDSNPPTRNPAMAAWGIHVVIVRPNEKVTLPSGRTLVYSSIMNSLIVYGVAERSE